MQSSLLDKLTSGERLTYEEGVALYDLDLFTLGEAADKQRQKRHGKKVFFNINRHINPTNVCKDICKFCGWYFGVFKRIKTTYPELHVKAMTAAEVDFFTREFGLSYDDILDRMLQAGVDSMPGGGAEIFDETVRNAICKGKVTSDQWLEIHRKWHERGRMSNATMLFGHVEKREHRIDHMIRLRDLQDQTKGFNAFIPLVYQRENNYLKVEKFPAGEEILKTMAISRIMLDNIPHIKAYWVTSTTNLALLACEFGADDLDGTIEKEMINSASGAQSAHGKAFNEFTALIHNAGFTPVERDSLYNELEVF